MTSTQRSAETASTRRMDNVTQEMRKSSQDFRLMRAKMMGEIMGHSKLHANLPLVPASSHSHVADIRSNLKLAQAVSEGEEIIAGDCIFWASRSPVSSIHLNVETLLSRKCMVSQRLHSFGGYFINFVLVERTANTVRCLRNIIFKSS